MKTLYELAENISKWIEKHGIDNFNLSHFVDDLNAYDGNDWKKCPRTLQPCYIRNKQNISIKYYGSVFDLIIISWGPKCATPVHNHTNAGCIYKVLEGKLVEELYDASRIDKEPLKISILKTGDTGYIDNDIGFHRVINDSDTVSVSLHIYESGYCPITYECFNCDSKL